MSTDESAYSQTSVITVEDPTHRTKLLMDRRQRKIVTDLQAVAKARNASTSVLRATVGTNAIK